MVGYPKIGATYRLRKVPTSLYQVVAIAEPMRFSGSVIEAKIILHGDDGKTYHTTLWEMTEHFALVYASRNPESVPPAPYPSPTAAFRAWETEV